jgi:CRP-like cAMP-binding protein
VKNLKNIFEAAKNNPLWSGIGYSDFESMLRCMEAKTRSYNKGDVILMAGDAVNNIGLIISGSVKVIKEDMDSNISILTELAASNIFGAVLACAGIDHSPVTVQASEKCEVVFFDYGKVLTCCSSVCEFHTRMIANMLKLIALKNLQLTQKIEILSKRTTRDKLLAFFDLQRGMAKKFTMPYNREEMAQYLCVDRSAMSNELCKMRDDGIIKFHKNNFELI